MDLGSLRKYMGILPAMYRMVEVLMSSGDDDEVVVTEDLYIKSLEVLDLLQRCRPSRVSKLTD